MLAPFLLTSLLFNTIQERIVNVGSMALASTMDFGNLQQVISAKITHFSVRRDIKCVQIRQAEPTL